jgi:hypothetical protein
MICTKAMGPIDNSFTKRNAAYHRAKLFSATQTIIPPTQIWWRNEAGYIGLHFIITSQTIIEKKSVRK